MNKDTINLRDRANFEIEVFKNIFWIPANALGYTRYTDEDIKAMLLLNPNDKKQQINNLYEALQLYQASRFKGIIDNIRVIDEDTSIMWVFHKKGYDSVRTNEGCCAANSNWLSYILNYKYDEIGCFGFRQSDGNGHITNYIKHNDWYYFIDMMMQRYDSAQNIGIEDGSENNFYKNEAFGYVYKVKCYEDYIKYLFSIYTNQPNLFYVSNNPECLCIGTEYFWQKDNEKNLYNLMQKSHKTLFKKNTIKILYSSDDCEVEFIDVTAVEPNWSLIKSFDFSTVQKA